MTEGGAGALRTASVHDSARRALDPEGPELVAASSMAMSTATSMAHIPALDGLRGLAVLGVLAFHGGYLTGGYLGVDLFFVLSGFLITTLLLREHAARGANDFKSFWKRRARRLLPALFGLLIGVALYARFVAAPYELPGIRSDSFWTVAYLANWHAIWSGSGYWQLFNAPSPLEHTWSLAIEEQFYVIWPLVFYVMVRLTRGRHGVIAVMCATLATVSAGWALVLYARTGDASRVYLGTDTRAAGILFGAALASVLMWRGPAQSRAGRVAIEALAGLAVLGLTLAWLLLPGESPWLYRGLLPLCGLGVVAVIAAASHPSVGPIGKTLSWAPLRWIGLISYGLYLWHWPVFVWFRRERIADGWTRFALEVALSLALAVGSYFIVEKPIRRGGLASWRWPALVPVAAIAAVMLVTVTTSGGVDRSQFDVAGAGPPTGPGGANLAVPLPAPPPASVVTNVTVPSASSPGTTTAAPRPVQGPITRPTDHAPRLLVAGDSVAWFVAKSLDSHTTTNGLIVGQRAAPSCALDDGDVGESLFQGTVVKEDPRCQTWRESLADDTRTFRPDATILLFGGAVFGQRKIDGEWHGFCDDVYRRHYRQVLGAMIDAFTSTGAPVFLVLAPRQTFPFLPDEAEAFNGCLNDGLKDAATARPDLVRLVRLDEWTCPSGQACREEQGGTILRQDGIHFDEGAGAEIVSPWLVSQIFTR